MNTEKEQEEAPLWGTLPVEQYILVSFYVILPTLPTYLTVYHYFLHNSHNAYFFPFYYPSYQPPTGYHERSSPITCPKSDIKHARQQSTTGTRPRTSPSARNATGSSKPTSKKTRSRRPCSATPRHARRRTTRSATSSRRGGRRSCVESR